MVTSELIHRIITGRAGTYGAINIICMDYWLIIPLPDISPHWKPVNESGIYCVTRLATNQGNGISYWQESIWEWLPRVFWIQWLNCTGIPVIKSILIFVITS